MSKKHAMEMFQKGGEEHLEEMNKLMQKTEAMKEWFENNKKEFDALPDSEVQATLLDIQDKIAVVKIVAEWAPDKWGCDYMLLTKQDDEWKINSILWQSVI